MDTFTGIPAAAIEFYAALEGNNNRQWWLQHKDRYDAYVLAPLAALLRGLEPSFGPGRIFRPYRDMRFASRGGPYKTAQGLFAGHHEGVGFYLQVDAGGLLIGGGCRSFPPAQLSRYRAGVDASASGGALAGIMDALQSAGFTLEGQLLKTVPRGFDRDHPRGALLRYKTLSASMHLGVPDWMDSEFAVDAVSDFWDRLRPLVDWIVRHAAP